MKLHHYTEIKLHVCVIGLPPQLDPISILASKRMSAQLEFEGITIFIRYADHLHSSRVVCRYKRSERAKQAPSS